MAFKHYNNSLKYLSYFNTLHKNINYCRCISKFLEKSDLMRKALKNKLSGLMRSLLRSSQCTILIFSIYLFIFYYCKKKTIHFPISSGRLWVFTLSSFSSWTPSLFCCYVMKTFYAPELYSIRHHTIHITRKRI